MNKRLIAIFIVIVIIISVVPVTAYGFNKSLFDFNYTFNYAYIDLPGGKVIEGKVQSWTDFEDGDQIQIKIGGVTYLTDTTRAVLVYDPNIKG